jgi:membrane protein DedA with SNARE-associated domain
MFDTALEILKSWGEVLSPPWFTFFGTMVEEIVAPIPSPIVMMLGGSFAASLHKGFVYLLFLALTGTIGKTIGSYVIYIIADKFEDILSSRFGKLIGITHQHIEEIGKRFGNGWKDNIAIFLLRAIPIMPTAPVSFVSGIIKVDIKTYLLAGAAGLFVRNIFYLYLGFTSIGAIENISNNLASAESIGSIIILILVALLVLYIYKKRRSLWKEDSSTDGV